MPRAKSDVMKPRGKTNAYIYFSQTCREEHKKLYPDEKVTFGDFARKASQRWKEMTAPERQRFEMMAENDKQRHASEMQYYVPPVGSKGKGKRSKDPNAPKRSLSGFFCHQQGMKEFCHDERPKVMALNPDYRVGDVAKVLGRLWAGVPPEVKSRYEQMASNDKARYQLEMSAYKKNGSG